MVNNPEGTAQVAPAATMSALPPVHVPTSPAPKLQVNLSSKPGTAPSGPRTNYSRVNTGAPMAMDAGASSQKSLQPKMAGAFFQSQSEVPMPQAARRPTLQQMLKHAMAGAVEANDQIASTARSLLEVSGNQKEAAAPPEGPPISREYAHKLASALDYYVEATFGKVAADAPTSPGHGPGALDVSESMDGPPISEDSGQAAAQPPMNPGTGKVAPNATDAATAMDNDADHRPGADAEASWAPDGDKTKISQINRIRHLSGSRPKTAQAAPAQPQSAMDRVLGILGGQRKQASAPKSSGTIGMIRKLAEDAINPAKITAAHNAPEPQTLEASDAGPAGKDKGKLPTTPEGVADATRRQVKTPYVREGMAGYVDETALSAQHDKVLQNAFAKTDEAGAKISSVDSTSAARALFQRLSEGG